MLQIILNTIQTAQVHNVNVQISASMHRSVMINVMFSSAALIRYSSAAYTSQIFSTASKARSLGKPARLIIRVLFGFASDLTNSTNQKNLQIVRRQCCLHELPSVQSYTSIRSPYCRAQISSSSTVWNGGDTMKVYIKEYTHMKV